MLIAMKNSKRYPVTARHPEKQEVFARTAKTAGSRGAVRIGLGAVCEDGLVWVAVEDMEAK